MRNRVEGAEGVKDRLAILLGEMNEPANDNALPTWKLIEGEALAALRELPSNSVDAVNTGRRAIGIEMSPEYAEIAARRPTAIGEPQSSGKWECTSPASTSSRTCTSATA